MIQNTFLFLEKIHYGLERKIWNQGIYSWEQFLERNSINGISSLRKKYYDRKIHEARKQLFDGNASYFRHLIPSNEHYRLYDFFKDEAVFLDIETTGLDCYRHDITLIGLFDGVDTKVMIKGMNLDLPSLKTVLQNYKLIITFNGSAFDVPFINKTFPGTIPAVPHIDVKHLTWKIGMTGGLKKIEKKLGIERKKLISEFNGGDALTLWKMYRVTKDEHYLNLLLEYNEGDIMNLKPITEYCIKALKKQLLTYLSVRS